jgi:hypothetical protein
MEIKVCAKCGKEMDKYGMYAGEYFCYECCAELDREQMRKNGKITLYLVQRGSKQFITNWPGSLELPAGHVSEGRHNIAGVQRTAYFLFEGEQWIAKQYGNYSDIAYCRRLKQKKEGKASIQRYYTCPAE